MYGLAGHPYTPGMPFMGPNRKGLMRMEPKGKGKAGQRTLRNKESQQRYKDKKHAKAD